MSQQLTISFAGGLGGDPLDRFGAGLIGIHNNKQNNTKKIQELVAVSRVNLEHLTSYHSH